MLYTIRSLKGSKSRYCVNDLEALFVVWAMKTFKLYIMSKQFKNATVKKTLKALVNKASLEGF